MYAIQRVKNIFDKVTSWPQLISKVLVAPACLHVASDWPCTFLHPRCFCLAYDIFSYVATVYIMHIIWHYNYS